MADNDQEREQRKKAIFDSMSPRRRKYISKIGYEKWDPFEEPKDPIDIRCDKTNRTTQQLVRQFLQNCSHDNYGNAYAGGVLEMALGIINDDDRFIGMYEFAVWYQDQLKKAGL
ncbi:MAG: hypothetical protein PVH87_04925 [Desulfobacteraceae bacterium]|jgi:hypothetical protein